MFYISMKFHPVFQDIRCVTSVNSCGKSKEKKVGKFPRVLDAWQSTRNFQLSTNVSFIHMLVLEWLNEWVKTSFRVATRFRVVILAKWLSAHLRTKWLCVCIPLQSLKQKWIGRNSLHFLCEYCIKDMKRCNLFFSIVFQSV